MAEEPSPGNKLRSQKITSDYMSRKNRDVSSRAQIEPQTLLHFADVLFFTSTQTHRKINVFKSLV